MQALMVGFANESLAVSEKVQTLTPSIYRDSVDSEGAKIAFITNYGDALRYFYDGSEPTASLGHVLPDCGVLILEGQQKISNFKFTRLSGETVITVTYERG